MSPHIAPIIPYDEAIHRIVKSELTNLGKEYAKVSRGFLFSPSATSGIVSWRKSREKSFSFETKIPAWIDQPGRVCPTRDYLGMPIKICPLVFIIFDI